MRLILCFVFVLVVICLNFLFFGVMSKFIMKMMILMIILLVGLSF